MAENSLLHGFDPTDTAGYSDKREIVPFKYNLGKATKGYARTAPWGELQLQVDHLTEEGPNKGNFARITLAAGPRLEEKIGTGYVTVTDPAKVTEITQKWFKALARFLVAYKLPTPTDEQLTNEILATEWLTAVEGKRVVYDIYDKDGYGVIPCLPHKESGNWRVAVMSVDEVDKGITAEIKARQAIEKWLIKQTPTA